MSPSLYRHGDGSDGVSVTAFTDLLSTQFYFSGSVQQLSCDFCFEYPSKTATINFEKRSAFQTVTCAQASVPFKNKTAAKANSNIITLILQSIFFELACLSVRDVLYEVHQLLK